MRTKLALWFGGLCALAQGCSPLVNSARTTIIEPIIYCRRIDNGVDCVRNKDLAQKAWEEFAAANVDVIYSPDFAKGFKAGYADYLYAGGSGQPPPVPPRYYWRPEFENPEGHRAIEDWFAGFARGAAAARESGFRQLVTVPASVVLPDVTGTGTAQANPGVPQADWPEALPPPGDLNNNVSKAAPPAKPKQQS
jgi:hypothetical protein